MPGECQAADGKAGQTCIRYAAHLKELVEYVYAQLIIININAQFTVGYINLPRVGLSSDISSRIKEEASRGFRRRTAW